MASIPAQPIHGGRKADLRLDEPEQRIPRCGDGPATIAGGFAQWLRGGRTTKIHAITDSQGRLFRFSLTPGNVADITEGYRLAAQLPSNGCLIGDMGYDALSAILSNACSVGSMISAVSPRVMTSWRAISPSAIALVAVVPMWAHYLSLEARPSKGPGYNR